MTKMNYFFDDLCKKDHTHSHTIYIYIIIHGFTHKHNDTNEIHGQFYSSAWINHVKNKRCRVSKRAFTGGVREGGGVRNFECGTIWTLSIIRSLPILKQ